MNASLSGMLAGFSGWIWEASWQAGVIALVVLIVRRLIGSRLSPGLRYGLWLLVVVRLLMPELPQSPASLYNAAPSAAVFEHGIRTTLGYQGGENTYTAPVASRAVVTEQVPVAPMAWGHWLAVAWVIGAVLLLLRLAAANIRFRQEMRRAACKPSEALQEILHEAATLLGMREPGIVLTRQVGSPAVVGVWHPVILLPPDMEMRFSPPEVRLLLLHELAHIRRGDLWVNLLASVLQCLHWFNPVLWLAFRRMRNDRELACDALVLDKQTPETRESYSCTLLKVLEGLHHSSPPHGVVGILEKHGNLRERLTRILTHMRPTKLSVLGGGVLLFTMAAMLLTRAETTKQEDQPKLPPAVAKPESLGDSDRLVAAAEAGDAALARKIIEELIKKDIRFDKDGATQLLNSLVLTRDLKAFSILLGELRQTTLGKDWQPDDNLLAGLVRDGHTDFLDALLASRLDLSRLRKQQEIADDRMKPWIDRRASEVERERNDIKNLIEACAKGDLPRVKQLLDAGVNVNACGTDGDSWTPLTRAASAGKADVVRLLLEYGAEVDLPKHPGWDYTPLCLTSSVEVANILKAAGANIHANLFRRNTSILTYVAMFNGAPMVQWFLDQGLDPKMIGDNNETLLFDVEDSETAEILLKAGVDPNHENEFGEVALQNARNGGVVESLIKAGAKTSGLKRPLLESLVGMNSGDALEKLFEFLPAPDQPTLQQALTQAAYRNAEKAAEVLIKHGAKANESGAFPTADHMLLPLEACCISGAQKTAKVLLANGADPNAGAPPGEILRSAILNKHKELVEILKVAGARVTSEPLPPIDSETIESKIDSWVLPQVELHSESLRSALSKINRLAAAADPNKKGVNFVLKIKPGGNETLKITINMENCTLRKALQEVAKQGNLKMIVDPYAISFFPLD